jgi:hypothetical protein
LTGRIPQLVPRGLRRLGGLGRGRQREPDQLRELHARYSPRTRVEGERRESRLSEPAGAPAPSLPLATLADAFDGTNTPPDVLVFGDSTSLLVSRFDVSRTSLVEMIVDRLAPLRTCVVSHIGWHGAVQGALLRAVASLPNHPRAVLLPMNIRQTTPQWAANPNFQFRELIDAAAGFAARPASGVPVVSPFPRGDLTRGGSADPAEWERFRARSVACTWRPQQTVGDYLDVIASAPATDAERAERIRDVFAFHWLPGNDPERLLGLADAVRTAHGFGARIIGQLTPVNYQAGQRLLGPVFDELVADFTDATIRTCRAEVADPELLVLEDLTRLLPSDRFFYETDPTEHFNEAGRSAVADRMARSVKRALDVAEERR